MDIENLTENLKTKGINSNKCIISKLYFRTNSNKIDVLTLKNSFTHDIIVFYKEAIKKL